MANDKRVPVYYMGVPGATRQVISVKQRAYTVETDPRTGRPVVGGLFRDKDGLNVLANDVNELLVKARYFVRGKGEMQGATTDPSVAAAVKEQAERGKLGGVPVNMSLSAALSILTTDQVREKVASDMSVEELERILEQKRSQQPQVIAADGINPPVVDNAPAKNDAPKQKAQVNPERDVNVDIDNLAQDTLPTPKSRSNKNDKEK